MVRRVFLIEHDPQELDRELRERSIRKNDEFNVIESFIVHEDGKITQLLSSSRLLKTAHDERDERWLKAEFRVTAHGWRLEKTEPRKEISKEEYYELLLSQPTAAVEPKMRTVFFHNNRRYSLEMNTERNYAVIQVDCEDPGSESHEELFSDFNSITVVGELFMSLEETFCRLYLKGVGSPELSRR